MATTYGPAARKMAMAQMLMRNANQPIHSPWNAISNLANTYMGWKMAGQAGDLQDARKADKQAKLQHAIRAGRGWTNPDDTYYQLKEPMRYYDDFVIKSPRGSDALEHSRTRDQWDKEQARWVANARSRQNFPPGIVSEYAKLRPEPLPLSQQPGAKLMQSPKGPMVPGSRQAMADVLMGSGHDDLVTMGMKLDPAFRDPLKGRAGTAIQYDEHLSKLTQMFPPQNVNGKLVDHPRVAQFKRIMKIGQPKFYNQPQGVVRVPTAGSGDVELVSPATLAPKDRPENIKAAKKAEGEAKTQVKLAEALPTRIQGIETKLSNLPFLDRNLQKVKDLAASPTTSGKLGVLTGLDPSSDQFLLNEAVVQFQSLIGLDSLVRLKATGATMGALNKEEMGLLVNKVGSLNTLADPSMLSETLDTVMYLYKKGIRGDQDKFAREYPDETPTWQLLDVPNPIHNNAIREANEAIEYQDSQGNDVRDEVRKRLQKKYPNIDLTGLK